MTDKEHDLAVYRDRLEDLRGLLSQAEDALATAEEDWVANISCFIPEDLEEFRQRMLECTYRCEELREEIAEVEQAIWQLESSDENESGEFFI